jgi:hypothetical protein
VCASLFLAPSLSPPYARLGLVYLTFIEIQ